MASKRRDLISPDDAFEVYFNQGYTRSLSRLYAELRETYPERAPSEDTLRKWSQRHKWQEKLIVRHQAINRVTEKNVVKEEVNARMQLLKDLEKIDRFDDLVILTAFDKVCPVCYKHFPFQDKICEKCGVKLQMTVKDSISVETVNDFVSLQGQKIKLKETIMRLIGVSDETIEVEPIKIIRIAEQRRDDEDDN